MTDIPALWVNIGLLIATSIATFIAGGSAIVAHRDKASSEAARDAALAAQEGATRALADTATVLAKSHDQAGVRMRAPYAASLERHAVAILAARAVGKPQEDVERIAMQMPEGMHSQQLAAGHPTAVKIANWVSHRSRYSAWNDAVDGMTSVSVVARRIRDWVFSPDEVMADIRANPDVVNDFPQDPSDPNDYRNP